MNPHLPVDPRTLDADKDPEVGGEPRGTCRKDEEGQTQAQDLTQRGSNRF